MPFTDTLGVRPVHIEYDAEHGVVSPNPIKFRQPRSSPATILSRSMIGLVLRNV
jgi:hypothetical protein